MAMMRDVATSVVFAVRGVGHVSGWGEPGTTLYYRLFLGRRCRGRDAPMTAFRLRNHDCPESPHSDRCPPASGRQSRRRRERRGPRASGRWRTGARLSTARQGWDAPRGRLLPWRWVRTPRPRFARLLLWRARASHRVRGGAGGLLSDALLGGLVWRPSRFRATPLPSRAHCSQNADEL
jgi:hypothetical protein